MSDNHNFESLNTPSNSQDDTQNATEINTTATPNKSMDWQKVAHKLREHNRKLIKKVFKLEQELAEINNRFQQQTQQSQTSDVLIAQQAEEIKECQQELAELNQNSLVSQQEIHEQKLIIENLTQQLNLSQQHSAQLERECALLQEKCNEKTYEAVAYQQKTEELAARLERQQRYTLQYKAALDKYNNEVIAEQVNSSEDTVGDRLLKTKNQPIKPWSVGVREDQQLPLPKASTSVKVAKAIKVAHRQPEKSEGASLPSQDRACVARQNPKNPTDAQIKEWPAPAIAKVNKEKQPQSLAAVELPQFPRQT